MKGLSAAAFSFLIASIVPASLSAKGDTVKITIKGADLTAPVEITGPAIAGFRVWAGPGVFVNGVEQTEGFIIDWPKGVIEQPPAGLQHYEVSFYAGNRADANSAKREPSLVYVVYYDYNPSTEQGFVYLPGKGDELLKINTAMWHGHDLEGNWFRATREWESFARPLIAKARTAGPGH